MGTKRTLTPRRDGSGRVTIRDVNALCASAEVQAEVYGNCRAALERFKQLGWDVTSADCWWRLYGPPELSEEPMYEQGNDGWTSAIVANQAFHDARKAWLVAPASMSTSRRSTSIGRSPASRGSASRDRREAESGS